MSEPVSSPSASGRTGARNTRSNRNGVSCNDNQEVGSGKKPEWYEKNFLLRNLYEFALIDEIEHALELAILAEQHGIQPEGPHSVTAASSGEAESVSATSNDNDNDEDDDDENHINNDGDVDVDDVAECDATVPLDAMDTPSNEGVASSSSIFDRQSYSHEQPSQPSQILDGDGATALRARQQTETVGVTTRLALSTAVEEGSKSDRSSTDSTEGGEEDGDGDQDDDVMIPELVTLKETSFLAKARNNRSQQFWCNAAPPGSGPLFSLATESALAQYVSLQGAIAEQEMRMGADVKDSTLHMDAYWSYYYMEEEDAEAFRSKLQDRARSIPPLSPASHAVVRRPYIEERQRERLGDDITVSHAVQDATFLINGDVLHVPFTKPEIKFLSTLLASTLVQASGASAAWRDEDTRWRSRLPGREWEDIEGFLKDLRQYWSMVDLELRQEEPYTLEYRVSRKHGGRRALSTYTALHNRRVSGDKTPAGVPLMESLHTNLFRAIHKVHADLSMYGAVYDVSFDPTGRFVAASSFSEETDTVGEQGRGDATNACLWDLQQGRVRPLRGHVGPVRSCRFNHGSDVLITGGHDGFVRMFDPATAQLKSQQQPSNTLNLVTHVELIATSPVYKNIIVTGVYMPQQRHSLVHSWDVETGTETSEVTRLILQCDLFHVNDLDFGRGRYPRLLLCATDPAARPGTLGEVVVWDLATSQVLSRQTHSKTEIQCIRSAPVSGQSFVTAGTGGHAKIHDVRSMSVTHFFTTGLHDIFSASMSPCETLVQFSGNQAMGLGHIFDTRFPARPVCSIAHDPLDPVGQDGITEAYWSSRSNLVTAGDDGAVRIWNVLAAQPHVASLHGDSAVINSVSVSPDSSMVVSGGDTGQVTFYSAKPLNLA